MSASTLANTKLPTRPLQFSKTTVVPSTLEGKFKLVDFEHLLSETGHSHATVVATDGATSVGDKNLVPSSSSRRVRHSDRLLHFSPSLSSQSSNDWERPLDSFDGGTHDNFELVSKFSRLKRKPITTTAAKHRLRQDKSVLELLGTLVQLY